MAELRQTFRPEFLNRIDDIIVFRALTEQDIEEVARRMLKTVAARMEAMDIHLDASDEAVKELAKEGFDPRYGARPLRRAIQSKLEDAVAEKMLDGTLTAGDTAKLTVEDNKLSSPSDHSAEAPDTYLNKLPEWPMSHPGSLLSKKHSLTDVGNCCVLKNLPDF